VEVSGPGVNEVEDSIMAGKASAGRRVGGLKGTAIGEGGNIIIHQTLISPLYFLAPLSLSLLFRSLKFFPTIFEFMEVI